MEEERSGSGKFKVVDKRRFSDSGDVRPTESAAAGETAASKDASNQHTEPRPNTAPDKSAEAAQAGVDFSSFVVSLATQALVMMGEVPHPETGRAEVNFDAARQTIDIVAMLEEKTRGNLTEDENNLLTEILASLRLAFVRKVNEQKKRKV